MPLSMVPVDESQEERERIEGLRREVATKEEEIKQLTGELAAENDENTTTSDLIVCEHLPVCS